MVSLKWGEIAVRLAVPLAGLLLGPAAAQAANELRADFATGGDDLRGGNDNLHLLLLRKADVPLRFDNVNGLHAWGNNSRHSVTLGLPDALSLYDIAGVRLETTSGGGIGGDNWNLDGLRVSATINGVTELLIDQRGAPLFRFTGDQRRRDFLFDYDADADGLADSWERANGHLGLSPTRANLILVPVLRPPLTQSDVLPTLDGVVGFYSRVPNGNPDGSTGIGVVIYWGNALPASDRDADSEEIRARGMPAAMIGKGHGVLIGPGVRGGGNSVVCSDWSQSSNDWHTVAHELGHQLCLYHEPRGGGLPSPLYASIMNYDYSFQFNGDTNAVRFSNGLFRTARLDERNLNERLPFPPSSLTFLSREPYHLTLRPFSWFATDVDFNRNGIFGESGVRAEINGGTAVTARDRVDLQETAGGFVLAALGNRLVAVYSDLPSASWSEYRAAGLSASNPGGLKYMMVHEGERSGPFPIADGGVTGDPHAVVAFGKLFIAYPTAAGYVVASYRPSSGGGLAIERREEVDAEISGQPLHPTLVRTAAPEGLYVLAWDETMKRVSYREVHDLAASGFAIGAERQLGGPTGLTSNGPVGAAWDSFAQELALVVTAESSPSRGRMKMIWLTRRDGDWQVLRESWAGGAQTVATLTRPTVLFDDRPTAGTTGQYLIFSRYEDVGNPVPTEVIRMTPGPSGGTWSMQLMMNVWTSTRSAPSATLYGDDVAWGWRVNEHFPEIPNLLQVFLRSSGITDEIQVPDFNDVEWIAKWGLRQSLDSVRR